MRARVRARWGSMWDDGVEAGRRGGAGRYDVDGGVVSEGSEIMCCAGKLGGMMVRERRGVFGKLVPGIA